MLKYYLKFFSIIPMANKFSPFHSIYKPLITKYPLAILVGMATIFLVLGYRAKDFKLDASADSLTLENDKNVELFREISKRYNNNSFLLMTYKPNQAKLFDGEHLSELKKLRNELRALERVENVTTILDVPLLRNPPVPINKLLDNIKNLEDPEADLELAAKEFAYSPIYKNLLISTDLKTTALKIDFRRDDGFDQLESKRNNLRGKQNEKTITAAESEMLQETILEFEKHKAKADHNRHLDLINVKKIMVKYQDNAQLYLGGVPMIADDMITYIKNDLHIFGCGMILFIMVILGVIFRKMRWVAISILCCFCSTLSMIGILGICGWKVTVISSNFVSLQLIMTMSLVIHLIVQFNELSNKNPSWLQRDLVLETVSLKLQPCLFATLTTIAGFSSLLVCDILPVINFGWMMIMGLSISLLITFFMFPAILLLLPKIEEQGNQNFGRSFIKLMGRFTSSHPAKIYIATGIVTLFIVIGMSQISVENSFINFFEKSTEIYQGMKVIDQTMGGTMPLDIMIQFEDDPISSTQASEATEEESDEFSEFDDFEEFNEAEDDNRYWYTMDKIAMLGRIHDYIDSLPETGKVLSLETMMKIAESFNNNQPLNNFQLALLYSEIPDHYRAMILDPYVSIENNQARINVRIIDSLESLQRNELLNQIKSEIQKKFGLKENQVQLFGMMVLYNNMLQSLFRSQIKTMGVVLLLLMIMFLILFRSLKLALIAIIPNLLSSLSVLGIMGLMGISLDMMTITIVAISIGIAVDDTIHYIHRFREEIVLDYSYLDAMKRCHNSVGNGMVYTSFTIITGFSILIFSNFIPSIVFGLLTGFAMLVALLAALTLLPILIITFKPFGASGAAS